MLAVVGRYVDHRFRIDRLSLTARSWGRRGRGAVDPRRLAGCFLTSPVFFLPLIGAGSLKAAAGHDLQGFCIQRDQTVHHVGDHSPVITAGFVLNGQGDQECADDGRADLESHPFRRLAEEVPEVDQALEPAEEQFNLPRRLPLKRGLLYPLAQRL